MKIIICTIIFVISAIISYLWVQGIEKMKEEHPDYKGEDLFNEKENEKNNIHK